MAEEQGANGAEAGTAEGGSKRNKWILIGAVVGLLLILGGGGAAAYFLLFAGDDSGQQEEQVAPAAFYTKIRTQEGRPMFVVSLVSDPGERHYMQIYVEALSRDAETDQALQQHMPLVVARLNAYFSGYAFNDLKSAEALNAMRDGATQMVQQLLTEKLGRPGVEKILFTNVVMQ